MKYLNKKFTIGLYNGKKYEEGWNRIYRRPLHIKIKDFIDKLLTKLFLGE